MIATVVTRWKVGTGGTATQEASKLVSLPHENHT